MRSQKARVQGRVILLELVHSPLRRAVLLLLQGGEQLLLQLREGIIIGRLVATEILAGVALRGPLVRGVVGHVGGGCLVDSRRRGCNYVGYLGVGQPRQLNECNY